jgi:oligopeptide transport system substrate-binding protein
MDMLLEAEKILVAEDAAVAPWTFYGSAYLVNPSIHNFVEHRNGTGFDIKWWRLEG